MRYNRTKCLTASYRMNWQGYGVMCRLENHSPLNHVVSSTFFSNKPEQTVLFAPEKIVNFRVSLFLPICYPVAHQSHSTLVLNFFQLGSAPGTAINPFLISGDLTREGDRSTAFFTPCACSLLFSLWRTK